MQEKIDRILKVIYKKWKSGRAKEAIVHPDEEDMACFAEGKLPAQETLAIKEHLTLCERCAENFALQSGLKLDEEKFSAVPEKLIEDARNIISQQDQPLILEVVLKLKEKALELLQTTGDVLLGQEHLILLLTLS